MKKFNPLFLLIWVSLLFQNPSWAASVSFDQLSISADLTVPKYNADMNTIYTKVNSNIQTDNIADTTLQDMPVSSDFAANSSPRLRSLEQGCEFVFSGLLPATSANLTSNISSGTGYPRGYRINIGSATSRTYTASRDTYVDFDQNGNFVFTEVANGATAPAVATNAIRLASVVTSATAITTVNDLRKTSCVNASYDQVQVNQNTATLDNLLRFGRARVSQDLSWVNGAEVSWDTTTTFIVRSGSAFFPQNSQYRSVSTDISVPQTADGPATGVSGLDTGAIAASTKYFVYLAADQPDVKTYSVSYSTSTSAPTGVSNYRKIGQIRTDVNSLFTSKDIVTTHSPGKVIQKVYASAPYVASTTTTVPNDNTIPQCGSEGAQFMAVSIDPVNPGDILEVEAKGFFGGASTTVLPIGFLCRGSDANAISTAGGTNLVGTAQGHISIINPLIRQMAQTTSSLTYSFRAGPSAAGTIYFNGDQAGTQQFGGSYGSYITVTEYESFGAGP